MLFCAEDSNDGDRKVVLGSVCIAVITPPITPAATQNLVYDTNGNLITGDGKYGEYNSFNQLFRIRNGNTSSGAILEEYIYHPTEERVLIKRVFNDSNEPRKIILYINNNFVKEYARRDAAWNWQNDNYYIRDDTGIVAEVL